MAKLNMDVISEFSESNTHNISFSFSNPSSANGQNSISKISKTLGEKKIFEVFHKKEVIINKGSSYDKDEKSKNSQAILYKCFYCENTYNYINRFESHMRTHVS